MPHPFDPCTLVRAPELATLAMLDALLFMATRVLVAEHPTLIDDDEWPKCRRTDPATLREARRVLRRIHPLQRALAEYRLAVFDALSARPPSSDDELPF